MAQTMTYGAEKRQGKRIWIQVNGARGKRRYPACYNRHDFPSFDSFVSDYLTQHVPSEKGGCYRKIMTPDGGTPLANLDDLEEGKTYIVATKSEPFHKLRYLTHFYNKLYDR
ncbi:hypothetical protein ACJMK2_000397 [Sinanodonta woodiana]|uniref:Doublecortin domain-containing protein n=1 Tax=Sinanodonta woodiana TaxID=1069815 RepID=A0ABD3XSP5_SINWO